MLFCIVFLIRGVIYNYNNIHIQYALGMPGSAFQANKKKVTKRGRHPRVSGGLPNTPLDGRLKGKVLRVSIEDQLATYEFVAYSFFFLSGPDRLRKGTNF